MKHFKKLIALFLAMVMAMSFAVTAMAAEADSGIPENATQHTIELDIAADGTVESYTQDGITPRIWNQINHTVSGDKTYTLQFDVPERYFAYEMRATNTSGNAINGSYCVELLIASTFSTYASRTETANGLTYKVDNIDLRSSSQRCLFCITNLAGVPLSVTITYYSWT